MNIPIIAIALFVVFAILAYKNRHNPTLWILLLGVGVIFGDLILLCGLYNNADPLHILEAFQMGTLNIGYSEITEKLQSFGVFYRSVFYILACLTPLVFAGFLLSFFKPVYDELRYFFKSKFRDAYIFSEVNETSINLARDIKAHEKNALIIFCQNDFEESALLMELYKNNFILLKRHITKFAVKSKYRRFFFAFCENQDSNFHIAQKLIREYQKIHFSQIDNADKVKIFVKNENLLPELSMDSRPKELKTVTVVFVNKSDAAANELLFERPLYIACDKNAKSKNINMLIVGTTACADKILRLALSCSQMGENYSAKFIVCDKDASAYRERLLREAPEIISDEYKIDFCDVDIESGAFKKILDKKCGEVNYIAVCHGNDEENFRTAVYLREYFIRKNPEAENMPFIGVYLQESERGAIESLCATPKENYNLFAFGKSRELFSYNLLVNSELEKLALNIHACYSWAPQKQLSITELVQSFNRSETDRKSNRANAVHIKYKLHILDYEIKLKSIATAEEIAHSKILTEELLNKLSNKIWLDALAKIEHLRWAAHERGDGWVSISKEAAKAHKVKTGTHKFNVAKMHPCLCSWQELDALGELIGGNPEMYKEYDRQICEFLPSILGLVENKDINISDVEYVLIKK